MRLSLRFKLLLSFSVIILLLLLVSYIGIKQGIEINQRVDDMYTQEVVVLENLDDLKSATYRVRGDILEFILARRESTRQRLQKEIEEQLERVQRKIDFYKNTRLSEKEQTLLNLFTQYWDEYTKQIHKIYELIKNGAKEEAENYARKVMVAQFRQARAAINDLMDYNVERASKRRQHSKEIYASQKRFIISLSAAAVILSILISLVISGMIVKATKQMSIIAQKIAQQDLVNLAKAVSSMASGDLTKEVNINSEKIAIRSKDEIGELVQVFNKMVDQLHLTGEAFNTTSRNLRNMIKKMVVNANAVQKTSSKLSATTQESARAIGQVSEAVHDISKGATQQSTSIEEIKDSVNKVVAAIENIANGAQEQAQAVERVATSITEMTTQIQEVSMNTQASKKISQETTVKADEGAKIVQDTIKSMYDIKESFIEAEKKVKKMLERTSEINLILAAMDEITSQTNLLAVNAAIEAAHAGEHGHGFAIVANEVKKLADRSKQEAQRIGSLIAEIHKDTAKTSEAMTNSINIVNAVALNAQYAEDALKIIIEGVKNVSTQIEQISIAAKEMAIASEEVDRAMNSVSVTVEQNSRELGVVANSSRTIQKSLDDITLVSQGNSAAAEQVSAMAEQMNFQIVGVRNAADNLSAVSKEILTTASAFNIGEDFSMEELSADQLISEIDDPMLTSELSKSVKDGAEVPVN